MEQTIIRLAIGLVLLVAVNVVLGSLNALFDGTFDRIKCRNGVIKGIIIAACFVAFYVAGRLNPDIVAIDIDGETVNVATASAVFCSSRDAACRIPGLFYICADRRNVSSFRRSACFSSCVQKAASTAFCCSCQSSRSPQPYCSATVCSSF